MEEVFGFVSAAGGLSSPAKVFAEVREIGAVVRIIVNDKKANGHGARVSRDA
jgi:hypothetical protein